MHKHQLCCSRSKAHARRNARDKGREPATIWGGCSSPSTEGQQGPTMPHKPHAPGLKCLTAPQPSSPPLFLSSKLNQTFFFSPPAGLPSHLALPPHPCPDAHQQAGLLHFFICTSPIPTVITVLWQQLQNFNSETISVTVPGFDSLPQTPLPLPASSRSHFGSEVVQVRRSPSN